jgi:hypothetical protein
MMPYQQWPRKQRRRQDWKQKMETTVKKIRLAARKLLILWRARRDLNPQPSDPKSDALSS